MAFRNKNSNSAENTGRFNKWKKYQSGLLSRPDIAHINGTGQPTR